ncbi:MAG: YaiI/YqxD family protein [Geminicoccaceae bacterium]
MPTGQGEVVLEVYVDGDACPVKDEVYRVAARYGLKTWVVANGWMRVPDSPLIELVTVTDGLDVADDWIVERAVVGDVVITADIPLADRCVKRGARVLAPNGRPFTEASIGNDLATRNLMTELRDTGQIRGGGRPFSKQDRSRFLGALDTAIQAIRRTGR